MLVVLEATYVLPYSSVHKNAFLFLFIRLFKPQCSINHVYQIQLLMAHFFHSLIAQYREGMGCLGQMRSLPAPAHWTSLPLSSTCSFIFRSWCLFCCEQRLVFRSFCCSAWLSRRNVNVMSVPDLSVLGHKNLSIVCSLMYSRLVFAFLKHVRD